MFLTSYYFYKLTFQQLIT